MSDLNLGVLLGVVEQGAAINKLLKTTDNTNVDDLIKRMENMSRPELVDLLMAVRNLDSYCRSIKLATVELPVVRRHGS